MNDTSDNRNYEKESQFHAERNFENDHQNHQNCEKIEQEDSKGIDREEKEIEPQKEAIEQQEASVNQEEGFPRSSSVDGAETVSSTLNQTDGEHKNEAQYSSCSYTPPYYVPNFTVVSSDSQAPKRSKKKLVALVGVIVALSILLSFCVGGLIGYRFSNWSNPWFPGASENLTVIKNDGSIKVNKEVGSTGYSDLSIPEVVNIVADTVVEITTSQVTTDFFYNSYVTSGAGSGVLIGENERKNQSYIITNHHVIDGADKIIVRLRNGTEYEANVLCGDADFDIAVLTISAGGLSYATLGSSKSLQVGEAVVAIGNPLGQLGGTVTDGIISALDRNVIIDHHRMTLLQTNAAINPGNSGGGLFNMAGELIGIVNAKQAQTGIEGLGFAIPIDVAWNVAEDMIEYGYVTGKLNLDFEIEVYAEPFKYSGYTFPSGVYIVESKRNTLNNYDRIVSINGKEISDIYDYYNVLDTLKSGDTIQLVVSRLKVNGIYYSFKDVTVNITVEITEAPKHDS